MRTIWNFTVTTIEHDNGEYTVTVRTASGKEYTKTRQYNPIHALLRIIGDPEPPIPPTKGTKENGKPHTP